MACRLETNPKNLPNKYAIDSLGWEGQQKPREYLASFLIKYAQTSTSTISPSRRVEQIELSLPDSKFCQNITTKCDEQELNNRAKK